MHSLNLTNRNVLITCDEVFAKSSPSTSTDPKIFLNSIEIAEETYVRPLLGNALYEALIAVKNVEVTDMNRNTLQQYFGNKYALKNGDVVNAFEFMSSAYQALWKQRLWRYVAECVKYVSIPENYAYFTSQGIMKNNPPSAFGDNQKNNSASVEVREAKWLMDKYFQERVEPMRVSVVNFLEANIVYFPQYKSVSTPNKENNSLKGFIDIYEDDNRYCGRDGYDREASMDNVAPPIVQQPIQQFALQWTTIPGQTQYPMPGQANEALILEQLTGASLLSITMEGSEMFIGQAPDECLGLDPTTHRISWNAASDNPLRMKAQLKK